MVEEMGHQEAVQELRVEVLLVYQRMVDLVVEVLVPLALNKDRLIHLVDLVVLMEMMVEVLNPYMAVEAAVVPVVLVIQKVAPVTVLVVLDMI